MSGIGPTIVCASDDRRTAVVDFNAAEATPTLNGLDYVEVDETSLPPTLHVYFLNSVDVSTLGTDNFALLGGERISNIGITTATPGAGGDATRVDLLLTVQGDFSNYALTLLPGGTTPGSFWLVFDPQLQSVPLHFHLTCPARFDCKPVLVCPPAPMPAVAIDYLAKDYATFRQAMLDRMSLLAPAWTESNPADIGMALVEVIAYAADRLSYRQDATATEAYLATARLRTSVRRHARLVDYPMHEGCNARVWIHLESQSGPVTIPAKTQFASRMGTLPVQLPKTVETFQTIAQAGALVFETLGPVNVDDTYNRMGLYAWSARTCCLPIGATQGTLAGDFRNLEVGTVLILCEILGPETGAPEDADPQKRVAVCLTSVTPVTDPLTMATVTNITWHTDDALPFPLCIANTIQDGDTTLTLTQVSAAVGNVVLADHGRTLGLPAEVMPETIGTAPASGRFRPALLHKGLTFAGNTPYTTTGDGSTFIASDGSIASATSVSTVDPTTATPLSLTLTPPWAIVSSLLDPAVAITPEAFVVEMENDGTAYLRCGDNLNGAIPDPGTTFTATYRVGCGTAGNVGADTIGHVIGGLPLAIVTNPIAAAGGVDPESLDHVRLNAPYAFLTQERAVTLADYAAVTERDPRVLRAAATFRITRSWRTVFITVELAGGQTLASPSTTPGPTIGADLAAMLDLYRMAGNDVQLENVTLVAIDVAMTVCVDPAYRLDEVQQALLALFSAGILPDGRKGMFYPDNFVMGQRYYLSPLIAAAQNVTGVASVEVTTFQRSDTPGNAGLLAGYLQPATTEAFQLRNSADYPERGTFTLTVDGGR